MRNELKENKIKERGLNGGVSSRKKRKRIERKGKREKGKGKRENGERKREELEEKRDAYSRIGKRGPVRCLPIHSFLMLFLFMERTN